LNYEKSDVERYGNNRAILTKKAYDRSGRK
jgi:hypothetical protein